MESPCAYMFRTFCQEPPIRRKPSMMACAVSTPRGSVREPGMYWSRDTDFRIALAKWVEAMRGRNANAKVPRVCSGVQRSERWECSAPARRSSIAGATANRSSPDAASFQGAGIPSRAVKASKGPLSQVFPDYSVTTSEKGEGEDNYHESDPGRGERRIPPRRSANGIDGNGT